MKKVIIISFLFFIAFVLKAQINLVPNPSFEDTLGCPNGVPDLDGVCKNWVTFRGTPDYFNTCSNNEGFYNSWGYQQAHTGNAYAGILEYASYDYNWKEQLGVQLISPLIINQKYYLSFYISLAYTYLYANVACNKIGALLTTYLYYDPNATSILPNYSTIYTNTIITDTINWTRVSGSFIADSAYQYIIIGSFFDYNHTDTVHLPYQVIPQDCIYYLDDICLTTDSIYNEIWTGLNEITIDKSIITYPNPSNGDIHIKSNKIIKEIQITNTIGQTIITENNINSKEINIPKGCLKQGIYIIKIETTKEIIKKKINIIH